MSGAADSTRTAPSGPADSTPLPPGTEDHGGEEQEASPASASPPARSVSDGLAAAGTHGLHLAAAGVHGPLAAAGVHGLALVSDEDGGGDGSSKAEKIVSDAEQSGVEAEKIVSDAEQRVLATVWGRVWGRTSFPYVVHTT